MRRLAGHMRRAWCDKISIPLDSPIFAPILAGSWIPLRGPRPGRSVACRGVCAFIPRVADNAQRTPSERTPRSKDSNERQRQEQATRPTLMLEPSSISSLSPRPSALELAHLAARPDTYCQPPECLESGGRGKLPPAHHRAQNGQLSASSRVHRAVMRAHGWDSGRDPVVASAGARLQRRLGKAIGAPPPSPVPIQSPNPRSAAPRANLSRISISSS